MTKKIALSQDKFATVDDEDFSFLQRFSWCVRRCSGRDYAVTANKLDGIYTATFMHRMILNAPSHMEVDHRNGDGLDNRKVNLRVCTHKQNGMNKRPKAGRRFKGVRARPENGKYRARVYFEGKATDLGRFDTQEEAARAYDTKAKELFGEFARLNFPELESNDFKEPVRT